MTLYQQFKTLFINPQPISDDDLKTSFARKYFLILVNHVFALSAYTLTVLKGTDFVNSLQEAYDLIRSSTLKFLVLFFVS